MKKKILGISAYYHDSAAVLVFNGEIIAAAQEERFTRKKHDSSFPKNSIRYVLQEGGIGINDLDAISFYEKPFLKFERLLETYHSFAPKGLKSFFLSMPIWLKEKLFIKEKIFDEMESIESGEFEGRPHIFFPEHHLSHCASAFYPSPYEESAILSIDGVGEWATTTLSYGNKNEITTIKALNFPHSLGLFYSAFTYYCGFKVNSGEYKLMGLAPYGDINSIQFKNFVHIIRDKLIDIRDDGSFLLNMEYFNFATGITMVDDENWYKLFGIKKRTPESALTQEYTNLALACQFITEEIIIKLARHLKKITNSNNLVMAGGVSLNCVANGKLLREGIFENLWIQPASGDAGGALGAALACYYIYFSGERKIEKIDSMKGSYLGPSFYIGDIDRNLMKFNPKYKKYEYFNDIYDLISEELVKGKIIGWFQGKMEWGPRALGNRSIIANPTLPEMQRKLNLKTKYRESFRPFAPAVLYEDLTEYFDLSVPSPYMLLVANVKKNRCKFHDEMDESDRNYLLKKLYKIRSDIPSVTHIDYTARIQTVHRETNEKFWELISAFKRKSGYGVVINTSFNIRGEPIVCTPQDAYRCFMRTEMDILVIENCVFIKEDQPDWKENNDWQKEFVLD